MPHPLPRRSAIVSRFVGAKRRWLAAGARPAPGQTGVKLWAPTAQAAWLCLHDNGRSPRTALAYAVPAVLP